MKKERETKKLGDVCLLLSGQHVEAKDYNTEGHGVGYLTGPSDFGPLHPIISKWTERPKIKAASGDILITVKGSGVGKLNLLDKDEVAISRQLMAIRVTNANSRFIHAFRSSTFDHFQSLSTDAAIPGISREQVLGLEIAFPRHFDKVSDPWALILERLKKLNNQRTRVLLPLMVNRELQ